MIYKRLPSKFFVLLPLAVLLFAFSLQINTASVSAAQKSDCNKTNEAEKCRKEVDRRCGNISVPDRKDDCIAGIIRDYKESGGKGKIVIGEDGKFRCGSDRNHVMTKFNFGCQGKGNPIVDIAFAIIRFLSIGIGIVIVGSIIFAGIQYSSSEGNPEQTAQAKERVKNAIFALVFYMFIFALLQYLVPGGLFNR